MTPFLLHQPKGDDIAGKIQREMRKIEIHRLQVQGLTDEEILASLNHIEEGQTRPRFPISRRQYYRDLQSLKNGHNQKATGRM